MFNLSRIVRRLHAGRLVAVLCAIMTAHAAMAQPGMGMGGMRGMRDPAVDSKELERFAELLKLTPDQMDGAKDLLDGMQTEHATIVGEMRDRMEAAREEARDNNDPGVFREMMTMMDDYRGRLQKLETSFFDDLKLTLNEEQLAKWPAVERMHRRDKTINQGGIVSGETVDLLKLTKQVLPADEPVPAEITPVLEQYEIELDKALVERNAVYESSMRKGMELWTNQDFDGIQKLFDEARDAAIKVRDLNRRFARQLEPLLPEALREKFSSAFQEASFPRVYAPSYTQKAFAAIEGMTDLDTTQKEQIAEIKAGYQREVASLNEKWSKAIEETELTRSPMQMFGMGGPRGGGPGGGRGDRGDNGNDATREARDARREFDNATVEKLNAVLTEDQKKKLPEREPERDWRRPAGRADRQPNA